MKKISKFTKGSSPDRSQKAYLNESPCEFLLYLQLLCTKCNRYSWCPNHLSHEFKKNTLKAAMIEN